MPGRLSRPRAINAPGLPNQLGDFGCRAHVLVAGGHDDHGVEEVRAGDGLDRVGDQIARLQGEAHPGRAVRDAVADAGRAELVADEAGLVDRLAYSLAEPEDVLLREMSEIGRELDARCTCEMSV